MTNGTVKTIAEQWYEEGRKVTFAKRKRWWQRRAKPSSFELFAEKLMNYNHDYNTIVYATAAVALAAARAMDKSPKGGITGFQGGAVMWEFICDWMLMYKGKPLRLVDYTDLLYPQHEKRFNMITDETWQAVQALAKKAIEDDDERIASDSEMRAHQKVRAHWDSIAAGKIPFGLKLGEE